LPIAHSLFPKFLIFFSHNYSLRAFIFARSLMSNTLAIAIVTATLRNLLMGVTAAIPDTTVTTKPPHKARSGDTLSNQLNLFLYQTVPNAAWRQASRTASAAKADNRPSPLALTLYYFLTAYGRDDDDINAHHLLGEAMGILHAHELLTRAELQAALPGSDGREQQEERIRITPQNLSSEELTRLWGLFQTPYTVSVAYQVSVVLLEYSPPTPIGVQ
jgi:hypothetical protein